MAIFLDVKRGWRNSYCNHAVPGTNTFLYHSKLDSDVSCKGSVINKGSVVHVSITKIIKPDDGNWIKWSLFREGMSNDAVQCFVHHIS